MKAGARPLACPQHQVLGGILPLDMEVFHSSLSLHIRTSEELCWSFHSYVPLTLPLSHGPSLKVKCMKTHVTLPYIESVYWFI